MAITLLENTSTNPFPPVDKADKQGLLAVGGNLSPTMLLKAYRQGIFPWFDKDDPILWWCPDPRMVLYTDRIKISKSLQRTLKKAPFTVTFDQAFSDVILACSQPRSQQDQTSGHHTWIHQSIIQAYEQLHQLGHAHSVECWQEGKLAGGLYGISIGKMFFGESMFSLMRDASKIAIVKLCRQLQRWGCLLIDCQIYSEHLASLGAEQIPRQQFSQHLEQYCNKTELPARWQADPDLVSP